MKKRTYTCTQLELYTIANLAWQSASQHLPRFAAFKAKYDAAFIAARNAALDNAKLLPSEDERNAKIRTLRIQLTNINRLCLNNFQDLKSYILDAFPEDLHEVEYVAAGQNNYDKASHRNWDSTAGLLETATHYITEKLAELTANQNMPPAFQLKFEADRLAFAALHEQFLDAEETAAIGTEEKVKMNNKIYSDLRLLCTDGQRIFRNEDAVRKQFTFTDLLYLVSGAGTAGLRGTITNNATGLPVANAILTIVQTNESDTSSDDGHYQVSPMAHGIYSISIVAEGYEDKLIPAQEVLTGTISTFNVELTPVI